MRAAVPSLYAPSSVSTLGLAPVVALLLLGSFAFYHLSVVPPFEDEGSQLRLIWRVIQAGEWLRPLSEGKPLEAWPMVPVAMLASQPFVAIRAVHVLCGLISVVLTYGLAREVTDRRTAFASAVLLAICPFVVYLERFAHSDILMCAAGIWVLLGILRLMQSPTWGWAGNLALALVVAALSKLPVGLIFLTSMPLALLLMPVQERRVLMQRTTFVKVLLAHAPAVLLALAVIAVTVVRTRRGQLPGFGVQDLMGIGLGRYHIGVPRPTLLGELTAQLSWPVVAAGAVGVAASAWLGDWRQRWLIVVGGLPMLGIGLLTTFWFSRYLLFTLPPLIVGAACGWHSLALRAPRYLRPLGVAVFVLCVGLMLHQSARLVLDPMMARWSPLDRSQYFEGVGSGYGYPEAARFILNSPVAPRMIYSLDGHSAYQLRTFLPAAWRERVQPVFYAEDGTELRSEESRLANVLSHQPAWIVVSDQLLQRYLESDFGDGNLDRLTVGRLASFARPGERTQLSLYEVRRR